MKYLFLIPFLLFSCAISFPAEEFDPPPEVEENPCDLMDCGAGMQCYNFWGLGICVANRRPSGFCNKDCGENAECRFDVCIESDPGGKVCEFDGVCLFSEFCIMGRCTEVACSPGETQPCYYGPPGTAGVGECSSGYHLCLEGGLYNSECIGEVLPAPDEGFLACNGEDNNCDGIVDELRTDGVDIVFAFDISGSMRGDIAAVSEAVRRLSILYDHPSIRLALILFPHPYGETEPHTAVPLSGYYDFIQQLSFLSWLGLSASHREATWDLPILLANNLQPEISFRPGARHVLIMFTDERGQTYFPPEELNLAEANNEAYMCRAIEDSGILLYVITEVGEVYTKYNSIARVSEEFLIEEDYDDCAEIFPLSDDPQDMVDNLSDIADLTCVE
jgi:hypothetical protein